MDIRAALLEAVVVDTPCGFFVNHDFAGYKVLVHADVPHRDAHSSTMSPVKAKGVCELGRFRVATAVGYVVYNATGVRESNYPITFEKLLNQMPNVA